jgi:hypothetical protein
LQSGAPAKPEPPVRYEWYGVPLYGDVESVTITKYQLEDKFGEVVRGDIENCEKYYFNEAGDVIEYVQYNPDGSLREKKTYKYDASRNLVEKAYYDSDGSLDNKHTYKYDALGNMIEEASYESDGSLDNKHTYKYDSSGNRIEETIYSGEALVPHSQRVFEITCRN